MNKRTTIVLIVLVLLSIGAVVFSGIGHKKPNVIITLSPSPAKLTLDKSKSVSSSFYTTSGQHSITASFAGFASITKSFTAQQNKITRLTIVLISNSAEGDTWLANHPAEQNQRQELGGKDFTQASNQRIDSLPILKQLPYYEEFFTVTYGQDPNQPDDTTAVDIYVTYYSLDGKQQAIDWLQSEGVDPMAPYVVYVNQVSDASQ